MPGTSVQQGDIGKEEKERIRNVQLDESESDDSDSTGDAMVGEVSRKTPTESEGVERRARERAMMAVVRATRRVWRRITRGLPGSVNCSPETV